MANSVAHIADLSFWADELQHKRRILLRLVVRCAVHDEAHVIKPEPGAAEAALAAND